MFVPTEPELWWRNDSEKIVVAHVRRVNGRLVHGDSALVEEDGRWLRPLDHGEAFVVRHSCDQAGREYDGIKYDKSGVPFR